MSFSLNQKLIFAVRGKNLELIKERLALGADINYQDLAHGSALVAAINTNDLHIVQFLLDNGANANAKNQYGVVPLEVALHHASDEIVRLLAWYGATLNSRIRPHWRERLEACLSSPHQSTPF